MTRSILYVLVTGVLLVPAIDAARGDAPRGNDAAAKAAPTADEWPQFAGPQRDFTSTEKGLAASWPATGPRVLWSQVLNDGFGGAAVQGGKVYVLDRDADVSDTLLCFDLGTGKEEWKSTYRAPGTVNRFAGTRSVPAVDDKFVFTLGPLGHFNCFDKATHKPVWSKQIRDDFGGAQPNYGTAQSPLLYKDWVILAPQSRQFGVVALDKATGKIAWKSAGIGEMEYVSPNLVTIDGVEQVVMLNKDLASGVDANTGQVLWTTDVHRGRLCAAEVIYCGDGKLVLSDGYGGGTTLIQVERKGQKFVASKLWQISQGAHVHAPIFYKDNLYILCNTNSESPGLLCVSIDGKVRWRSGDRPNFDKGGLLLADDRIYELDGQSGDLYLIQPDPAQLKIIARAPAAMKGGTAWAPLALADGKLLVRDQSQMKCFDVNTPARLSPAVDNSAR